MELTRRLSLCLGCCFVAMTGRTLYGAPPIEQQTVVVEKIPQATRLSLGTGACNQTFHCVVVLQNKTGRDWSIGNIETDCGCLSATVEHNTVTSGETVALAVQLAGTNKLAKVRRSVRVWIDGFNAPIALKLDLRVVGPLELTKSIVDVKPESRCVNIEGRKRQKGMVIEGILSGRGGFLVAGDIDQDETSFRIPIRPLAEFGAFSDVIRARCIDADGQSQLLELPIELRSSSRIRFLPSTVPMHKQDGRWSGRTRLILLPDVPSEVLSDLRFKFAESDVPLKIQTSLHPLSSVLSIVELTIDDDGQPVLPHIVEIEDRNGSLLGKLQLSPQGQMHVEP